MTANHEHTPTTEQVRLAHAESVTFHVMEEPELTEANNMFDRWYQAEIAAAEQRGAVQHLRAIASDLNMHNVTEALSDEALELGVRIVNMIQDRADQMEDDDEQG